MAKNIGLWIDHRKASMMFITESGEETKLIISNVERQRRRLGNTPLKGAFERVRFSNDINEKRNFKLHLSIYYDSVIACVQNADSILIMGPGEAKNELKARMEEKKMGPKITVVETVGFITENRLKKRIRDFYATRGNGRNGSIRHATAESRK
jgi:stalled ribosome rescue protein Dom34